MKVQWKHCLEFFGQSPKISNSRELKPTLGLKEKMDKRLLNTEERCSYRRRLPDRSCSLCCKENGATKPQRELEPWKQNYPIRIAANSRREEAGENKYPTVLFSCFQISCQDLRTSQVARELRRLRHRGWSPEVWSRLGRAVRYASFWEGHWDTHPWATILIWPLPWQLLWQ